MSQIGPKQITIWIDVEVLETQERAAYADKPWAKQDKDELEAWQTVQSWDDA